MSEQTSCATALKRDIESRFGVGDLFTMLDFSELEKTYNRKQIRSGCQSLSESGYMDVVGKYSTKKRGLPPVNHYRVAKIPAPVYDYPAGSETIWHLMKKSPPVNPGNYHIEHWDGTVTIMEWRNGGWVNVNGKSFASVFVMQWRGVTR